MSGSTAIRLPILLCPNLPFHRLFHPSPPPIFWPSRPEKNGARRNSSASETPTQCSKPLQPNPPLSHLPTAARPQLMTSKPRARQRNPLPLLLLAAPKQRGGGWRRGPGRGGPIKIWHLECEIPFSCIFPFGICFGFGFWDLGFYLSPRPVPYSWIWFGLRPSALGFG